MLLGMGGALILIGLFAAYMAYELYAAQSRFESWPTTPGKILSIDIQPRLKPAVSATASSASHRYWMVVVSYEYVVNGRALIGTTFSNSPKMENLDQYPKPTKALTESLAQYPVGELVTVHYSKDMPERSLLEIETGGARPFIIAAALAIVLGLLCLVFAL